MSKLSYLAVIPDDVADTNRDQSYLRLPHPRTGAPQLYLPSVDSGRIYEVVKVNGSKRRTWFIGDDSIDGKSILIHHPVDPLFLVIPLILSLLPTTGSSSTAASSAVPFQPFSSLISTAGSSSAHALAQPFTHPKQAQKAEYNEDVSRLLSIKSVRRVFRLCCDKKVVPNGPPSPESLDGQPGRAAKACKDHTTYYRPSQDAILRLLRAKVEWFAQEPRWAAFDHNIRQLGRDGLLASGVDDGLVKSARLRSSIDHFAQFLPPQITRSLNASYDFAALDTHLANMSAAALAASMPPTNLSNKADKAATGAGAKRKAAGSRGVEALKKVNTASMNKLTSFFKPKDK